ncbi:hypothetical protein BSN85_17215 [Bradyrhizobium brasilense]|uniref:hypothetical protein n=1 Tax=Bradyrhizobium brasilense TaxID=1419277 RepID=UPI000975ECD3|nr:hypothetical protein [Bradyrhizobium brasilense]OMI09271.1 hypothetical protein BSN85_17215 [Bradyrhizobium brasilense]
MGSALETIFDSGVEIHASDKDHSAPGLDWHLSEEAKRTIDEIESNIRAAEQMSGRLVAG